MAHAGVAASQCNLPTIGLQRSGLNRTRSSQGPTVHLVFPSCEFGSVTQRVSSFRVGWNLAALKQSHSWQPGCHRSPFQPIRAESPGGRSKKTVVLKQGSRDSKKEQNTSGAKSFWDAIERNEDGPDVVPSAANTVARRESPPAGHALKKDGNTFVYHINGGGRVLASVRKEARRFMVTLEVNTKELEIDSATALHLHWGLSRSDSDDWVLLDGKSAPPNTTLSGGETEAMRTPILETRPGMRRIEIPLDARKAPVELHFVLYQPPTEKVPEKWFRSTKESNFSVPVGLGRGSPDPLGATWQRNGSVNFALYSRNAEGVILCLFKPGAVEPSTELDLSPGLHRTGDVWHVQLESVEGYDRYGYRVRGAVGWATGNRFHSRPVLLDPYAHFIAPHVPGQEDLPSPALALGLLQPDEPFDWEGDYPPLVPMEELIAYKLHVGGFTRDASSGVAEAARGTFLGVVEKVQHLVDMGVNAVILQPIAAFDETLGSFFPISFFAPASIYGPGGSGVAASRSLKLLVKELHRAGIEVLLDVVYSHTAEGNDEDPKTVSLRGIDNATYYLVDEFGQFKIPEFGVGNAFNCNHPTVQRMIVDSIRRWVEEFHVDGFCFANAGALVTGPHGQQLSRPLLVEALAFDPVLADTKLIADMRSPITGVNQPVDFPHWSRWAEWNSRYRDDVRRFIRGEGGQLSSFATRLVGSGDIFDDQRGPGFSFNHITSPYGYTLADVVSYTGYSDDFRCQNEFGWNAGVEGQVADPGVTDARQRQMRTYLVALFLSQGVPVLTMGDEYGHTKNGNLDVEDRNSVFHWGQMKGPLGQQLKELIARLVAFREEHPELLQRREYLLPHELVWHGYWPAHPEWDNPSSAFLAASLHQYVPIEEPESDSEAEPEPELEAPERAPFAVPGVSLEAPSGSGEDVPEAVDPLAGLEPVGHGDLYIAFNAHADQVTLGLPAPPRGTVWHRLADTSMPVESYFVGEGDALHAPPPGAPDVVHPHGSYDLAPFSALLLEAKFPKSADGVRRPPYEMQTNKAAPFAVNLSGF